LAGRVPRPRHARWKVRSAADLGTAKWQLGIIRFARSQQQCGLGERLDLFTPVPEAIPVYQFGEQRAGGEMPADQFEAEPGVVVRFVEDELIRAVDESDEGLLRHRAVKWHVSPLPPFRVPVHLVRHADAW